MPLEIRELHIKATISDDGRPEGGSSSATLPEQPTDEIIRACVDQVLQILKEKAER
ncbi:MAG: hypothetical protein KDD02_19100 [Phaeodactylibacter sp.]|nr:hypothetical protein [Phaeodactylibacter sp.]MCB9301672.1 hypothetical protein [Lewinellaceae bacterium]